MKVQSYEHASRSNRSCEAARLEARGFVFDPRRLAFVNAARALIPIETVEDHDLEWLEERIAEIETVT